MVSDASPFENAKLQKKLQKITRLWKIKISFTP